MTRFLQLFLYPVSVCYGLIVQFRNLLFDIGLLPSKKFNIPVISIGNLSMGGTGKTPHIEYLIRHYGHSHKIATLSRGYGRRSKGFLEVTPQMPASQSGDEPLQFVSKFNNIIVAVDEKRTRGIHHLTDKYPDLQMILLDDAFQHRYVKPGLSILLTDYRRLYIQDYVVPCGTLREFRSGARRADIIIVTKTPKIFSPITRRRILDDLKTHAHQQVFFSYITYGEMYPVFPEESSAIPPKTTSILLFTGIANDYPLAEHLERLCSDLVIEKFSDHHDYTDNDLKKIISRFSDLPTQKKIMVTTEKDAMRLKVPECARYFKNLPLFCIPMEIEFHGTDKANFDDEISSYVKENSRNRRVP